ncbi:MAG: B12-binding domain-containing radical SAM protein [Clostridiales bacterium]|nr:B12-binding domain-containing radical SAM protein [Clostridiales bacterium]
MNILLVAINAKYIHSNLAVYSLRAYAKEYRNQISICEYTINNRVDEIIENIYWRKPDILAFSCYIWNIEYVNKITKEIRKVLPNTKIWLGGPEAYYNSKNMLINHPEIDLVMKGEGEETFRELLSMEISHTVKIENILGVDYIDSNGDFVENPLRVAMDMSTIPFPYEDLKDFENKIIYYESSRGCPFLCSYCLSSVEKQLRFRNIEIVKKELQFFIDNKTSQVKFVDRTFNCNKTHAMEIWKYIYEHDNGITNFHFEVAADLIGEDELELMSKMRPGLIQLEIGVQSTNEDTIREIRRKMDLDKLKQVTTKVHSFNNIHQHLDLIAGLPYEGMDSFKRSFDEVYRMAPDQLQLGFLKVLAGSYMYDKADDYGVKYKEYPPYEVMATEWISYDEILHLKLIEEMVETYYNSGQFRFTIKAIEKLYESPYKMFEDIGLAYEGILDKNSKHTRMARYKVLDEFSKSKDVDITEYLTLDMYLRENMKTRPPFSKDLSKYKDIIKHIARLLKLEKQNHIEVFKKSVLDEKWICEMLDYEEILLNEIQSENIGLSNREFVSEKNDIVFAIFDYTNRNPLNYQCKLLIVNV